MAHVWLQYCFKWAVRFWITGNGWLVSALEELLMFCLNLLDWRLSESILEMHKTRMSGHIQPTYMLCIMSTYFPKTRPTTKLLNISPFLCGHGFCECVLWPHVQCVCLSLVGVSEQSDNEQCNVCLLCTNTNTNSTAHTLRRTHEQDKHTD